MTHRPPGAAASGKTLVPTRPQGEASDAGASGVDSEGLLRDAADIELQRAMEQGFAQGFADGHAQGRREGYECGFGEGRAEGVQRGDAEGREELAAQAERLARLAQALSDARAAVIVQAEDDLVCIAYEAVCKLVGTHLVTSAGVAAHVRGVIGRVAEPRGIRVRLHPHDLDLVREYAHRFGPAGQSLEWCVDETLAFGGCVIEAAAGEFRARLDEQLRQVLELLQSARAVAADAMPPPETASIPSIASPSAELVAADHAAADGARTATAEAPAPAPKPPASVFSMKWGAT